ncbi:polyphosphate kinase 2 family protein [Dictyobacter arantiisoli]|uniref:PPK2 family polyphosphate--nucleotide phosphotransferase n=1 Tax=Dictyobacter arantiisoli TaxID=2014874 RepID=A0A5A5TJV8_9CHLR|nr:polyphosphate kinase 2 family protein [Dictyobacter arantiisoli]GCF11900.1 PPK2 family polyphosphate--nucleotide phosphotransferase [Dictyobacter arantiisoli]
MSHQLLWKVPEGEKIKLHKYDPSYTHPEIRHEDADDILAKLGKELGELQELLSAAQHHSLLMIVQGMDTSGKDGTISHVFSQINPQGCEVHSFKVPTAEEAAHDFLWRIHKATPAKGMLGIFNRSQYEDVLVTRVHNLVPEEVWSKRYTNINNFEKLLHQNGTIILKFFLHISQEEQTKRLKARVDDKDKAWKISTSDFAERKYWDDYQKAYEDALSQCSTDEAPWYIVPADHKWYRNVAIAQTLVDTMQQYKDEWTTDLEARGHKELEELQQMRATKQITDI